jgi:hypothetical protein
MKNRFASSLIAFYIFTAGVAVSQSAQAQSEASALSAISALPVASVVVTERTRTNPSFARRSDTEVAPKIRTVG